MVIALGSNSSTCMNIYDSKSNLDIPSLNGKSIYLNFISIDTHIEISEDTDKLNIQNKVDQDTEKSDHFQIYNFKERHSSSLWTNIGLVLLPITAGASPFAPSTSYGISNLSMSISSIFPTWLNLSTITNFLLNTSLTSTLISIGTYCVEGILNYSTISKTEQIFTISLVQSFLCVGTSFVLWNCVNIHPVFCFLPLIIELFIGNAINMTNMLYWLKSGKSCQNSSMSIYDQSHIILPFLTCITLPVVNIYFSQYIPYFLSLSIGSSCLLNALLLYSSESTSDPIHTRGRITGDFHIFLDVLRSVVTMMTISKLSISVETGIILSSYIIVLSRLGVCHLLCRDRKLLRVVDDNYNIENNNNIDKGGNTNWYRDNNVLPSNSQSIQFSTVIKKAMDQSREEDQDSNGSVDGETPELTFLTKNEDDQDIQNDKDIQNEKDIQDDKEIIDLNDGLSDNSNISHINDISDPVSNENIEHTEQNNPTYRNIQHSNPMTIPIHHIPPMRPSPQRSPPSRFQYRY